MAVTFAPTAKTELLSIMCKNTGGNNYTNSMMQTQKVMGGTQPADPTVTAGLTNFGTQATLTTGSWTAAAGGVLVYSGVPITVSNTSGFTSTPAYVRIGTGGVSAGAFDVPVGLVGSGAACIVSSVSAIPNGSSITIDNLRVKIPPVSGNGSLNAALVNKLVESMACLYTSGVFTTSTYLKLGYGETANASTLTIYGGTMPASADAAASSEVLATYTVGNAVELFGTAIGGALGLASSITVSPTATGTATHFRLTKNHATHGALTMQGDVGTSGTIMVVDSVSFTSGVNRSVTALGVSM